MPGAGGVTRVIRKTSQELGGTPELLQRLVAELGLDHEQPLLSDPDAFDPLHDAVDQVVLADGHHHGTTLLGGLDAGTLGQPARVVDRDALARGCALALARFENPHVEARVRTLHLVEIHSQVGCEERRLLRLVLIAAREHEQQQRQRVRRPRAAEPSGDR